MTLIPRRLWTGPPGAAVRNCLLAELGSQPAGLWITPTPLARDQVTRELTLRSPHRGPASEVFCWGDLWRMVRREAEDGPVWLSRTAARAVFDEAINQARKQGRCTAIERVIGLAGYQRRLARRFQFWTLAERKPRRDRDRGRDAGNPVELAEEAVFELYRAILEQLGADDEAGMMVWASKRLAKSPRFWAPSGDSGPVVFLDFGHPRPPHWRILERALKTERAVHVALCHDPDPALAEVYLTTESIRASLVEKGLVETRLEPAASRPEGLRQTERLLFRNPTPAPAAITEAAGLSVRGAPQGDGVARILAREVRDRLGRGVAPEEILIVTRHWSDEAELTLEMLRAWDIPAHAELPRPLRGEPAAAALKLAASIPLEDWETELIISLLRHGQFQPDWPAVDRISLARAASAIKSTSVFRGSAQLLAGLDRLESPPGQSRVKPQIVAAARDIAGRLIQALSSLDQSRPWSGQVSELRRLALELGLDRGEPPALEALWDALDDQTDMLERLDRDREPWSWAAFTGEVETILGEIEIAPSAAPGAIRLATVDQVEGARAGVVILADLAEGTFPAREAVEPLLALGPLDEPDEPSRKRFADEMLRFLKVLGSADSHVVLAYPSTDLKGQELLRAGFLDDLLALISPEARAALHVSLPRLDPALLDQPELAGSAADRRIRALALASSQGETGELVRLARDPAHRSILDGTAAALYVQERRMRGTEFSEFEGMLSDRAASRELERKFGPDYPFSPSQLETYIGCPFQFFCKYVLDLQPVEEKDELDEDLTERGSQLHDILENFETLLLRPEDGRDPEQIARVLVERVRNQEMAQPTELDQGLWEIERERLIRTIYQYLEQRKAYHEEGGVKFRPYKLELDFGSDGAEHPVLVIGQGERTIRLRGRIDRIDVADTPEGPRFRVIDYKSGAAPSTTDVKHGEMLQLPLYAMAVEQLLFQEGSAMLADLGYWSLKKDGYKSISFASWDDDQKALIEHVLALVDDLRRGVFVVQSRTMNCESYCEYRNVCQIGQVRRAEKNLERGLPELSVQSRRGRKASAGAKSAPIEEES
ncbi:MAG: PD-(D/E)XK nuclease family protein [Isosphaeraceae bacterium]